MASNLGTLPESRKIETTTQQDAYPASVSNEVAQLLANFEQLPDFSQRIAMKVLKTLPGSVAANEDKFQEAA